MRAAAILAVTTAMFVPHAAFSGDVRHSGMPEDYSGRWAPDPQVCKDADRSVIVLSAKAYSGPEGACTIEWVVETASPRGPSYSVHMLCSNVSDPAQKSSANLIVRPDSASQISVGSDFSKLKIYQRCPANEPAPTR